MTSTGGGMSRVIVARFAPFNAAHPMRSVLLQFYEYPPFCFQVCGACAEAIAPVLQSLTDRGKVPEALRLAHLIGAAIVKGESGSSAYIMSG